MNPRGGDLGELECDLGELPRVAALELTDRAIGDSTEGDLGEPAVCDLGEIVYDLGELASGDVNFGDVGASGVEAKGEFRFTGALMSNS